MTAVFQVASSLLWSTCVIPSRTRLATQALVRLLASERHVAYMCFGVVYIKPTPKMAITLNLFFGPKLSLHRGAIGRINMNMSVKALDAADTQGRMVSSMHSPGTAAFHSRSIGWQLKSVAKKMLPFRQMTNAMPIWINVLVVDCVLNMRR
jgi:hypothetical protein